MTARRQHDWERLDGEYFECTRCHTWSRTRHDGECSVEVLASSAAEPVPAGPDIAAEFSQRQAEESAKRQELRLREQRLAEARRRKEQRDARALKRKHARRPSKLVDRGEREDLRCEREPVVTTVEMPPIQPNGWIKFSDLQRALGRRR